MYYSKSEENSAKKCLFIITKEGYANNCRPQRNILNAQISQSIWQATLYIFVGRTRTTCLIIELSGTHVLFMSVPVCFTTTVRRLAHMFL